MSARSIVLSFTVTLAVGLLTMACAGNGEPEGSVTTTITATVASPRDESDDAGYFGFTADLIATKGIEPDEQNSCLFTENGNKFDPYAPVMLWTLNGEDLGDVVAISVLGIGRLQQDGSCKFRVALSFPLPADEPPTYRFTVSPVNDAFTRTIEVPSADIMSGHLRLPLQQPG
jgi:hypothetical protein